MGFITLYVPGPFSPTPCAALGRPNPQLATNTVNSSSPQLPPRAGAQRRAAPSEAAAGAILPPAARAELAAARWRPCAAAGLAATGLNGKGEADIMPQTGWLARPQVPVGSHPGKEIIEGRWRVRGWRGGWRGEHGGPAARLRRALAAPFSASYRLSASQAAPELCAGSRELRFEKY